jgi:hypothetical protein
VSKKSKSTKLRIRSAAAGHSAHGSAATTQENVCRVVGVVYWQSFSTVFVVRTNGSAGNCIVLEMTPSHATFYIVCTPGIPQRTTSLKKRRWRCMRRAKQGAHSISFADAQHPGSRAAWSQNALTHLRRAAVLHERKHLARCGATSRIER